MGSARARAHSLLGTPTAFQVLHPPSSGESGSCPSSVGLSVGLGLSRCQPGPGLSGWAWPLRLSRCQPGLGELLTPKSVPGEPCAVTATAQDPAAACGQSPGEREARRAWDARNNVEGAGPSAHSRWEQGHCWFGSSARSSESSLYLDPALPAGQRACGVVPPSRMHSAAGGPEVQRAGLWLLRCLLLTHGVPSFSGIPPPYFTSYPLAVTGPCARPRAGHWQRGKRPVTC